MAQLVGWISVLAVMGLNPVQASSFIFDFVAVHRPVGLVVRRRPRERKIPGSNPACAGIFLRGRVIPLT